MNKVGEARVVRFFNDGNNAPAYSCDTPENQSGFYVRSEEYQRLASRLMKAMDRIEKQRERICYLEGATNHAGGTPLSKAEAENESLKEKVTELQYSLHSVREQLKYEYDRMAGLESDLRDATMIMKVQHSDSVTSIQKHYQWKMERLQSVINRLHEGLLKLGHQFQGTNAGDFALNIIGFCACGHKGTPRVENSLPAGVHCDKCWEDMKKEGW